MIQHLHIGHLSCKPYEIQRLNAARKDYKKGKIMCYRFIEGNNHTENETITWLSSFMYSKPMSLTFIWLSLNLTQRRFFLSNVPKTSDGEWRPERLVIFQLDWWENVQKTEINPSLFSDQVSDHTNGSHSAWKLWLWEEYLKGWLFLAIKKSVRFLPDNRTAKSIAAN